MTDDITAYPGEDEVLIQDGFEYLIIDNIEQPCENSAVKFRLIKLSYSHKVWLLNYLKILVYI